MKFIHAADVHMDQPFANVTTDNLSFQKKLQQGNDRVFTAIVDRCLEHAVDFLLLVGDTFHQAQSSIRTQQFLMAQLARLNEAGIPVILSFGNHDYYSESRYWFDWPENVLLFKKEEVETKTLKLKNGETVSISGFSYEHQWISSSQAVHYPNRNPNTTYHIGTYHGAIGSDNPYAPFHLSQLNPHYDYWALGHIHKSEVVSDLPRMIYAGTPQAHTKKDKQANGVVLVEVSSSGKVRHEWLDVSYVGWLTLEVAMPKEATKAECRHILEEKLLQCDNSKDISFVMLTLVPEEEQGFSELMEMKEELLGYLQQRVLDKSGLAIWLASMDIKTVDTEVLLMGFDASLIDDLGRQYLDEDTFYRVANDILQQPTIASYITLDTMDMVECVTESSQLVKDKLIFKNGAKE